MAEVASYHVLVYGGPDGYQTNRAQIQLSDAAGKTLAWLRFPRCTTCWGISTTLNRGFRGIFSRSVPFYYLPVAQPPNLTVKPKAPEGWRRGWPFLWYLSFGQTKERYQSAGLPPASKSTARSAHPNIRRITLR